MCIAAVAIARSGKWYEEDSSALGRVLLRLGWPQQLGIVFLSGGFEVVGKIVPCVLGGPFCACYARVRAHGCASVCGDFTDFEIAPLFEKILFVLPAKLVVRCCRSFPVVFLSAVCGKTFARGNSVIA